MRKARTGNTRVFFSTEIYATNADIESIVNRALANLATKDDIANLATKEELKSEVSELATKTELTSEIKDLKNTIKVNHASISDSMNKEFTRQNKNMAVMHTQLREIKEHLGIDQDESPPKNSS